MSKELTISTRGIEMPESPIRNLAPLAYKAEDEGVKIYRLNIGQPELPTPQKALDALSNIAAKNVDGSIGSPQGHHKVVLLWSIRHRKVIALCVRHW